MIVTKMSVVIEATDWNQDRLVRSLLREANGRIEKITGTAAGLALKTVPARFHGDTKLVLSFRVREQQ